MPTPANCCGDILSKKSVISRQNRQHRTEVVKSDFYSSWQTSEKVLMLEALGYNSRIPCTNAYH